jgi:regulation of enolase protein 1 (concanavalin A-like superfamily)
VWGNIDQHFYAWKQVKGDFSMTTKVSFEGKGINAHRKIGIMIRDALTGESRCVHISIHGDGLTSLQYRSENGGQTREIKGPPNGNYITLEKIGNKIRMRTATDVLPKDVTAEVEMDFPGAFYIGFFVCSHDVDILETAYFTKVEFKKL